jgi:hypothetical protein
MMTDTRVSTMCWQALACYAEAALLQPSDRQYHLCRTRAAVHLLKWSEALAALDTLARTHKLTADDLVLR